MMIGANQSQEWPLAAGLTPCSLQQQARAAQASSLLVQQQQQQQQHNHSPNIYLQEQPQLASGQQQALALTKFAQQHLVGPLHALDSRLDYLLEHVWRETGDERTSKLPLIGSGPWKLLGATLLYLYLIKRLLPRVMSSRQPLVLQWPIRAYNLIMVLSNMWAFYHGARILNFGLSCFGCETIDHKDYSAPAIELLHYGWLFFLSRLVEWLDTIFFVLRKKDKQVSKLHVFHHSFVPLLSWTYLKYHPGYTVAFFPFVNSLVHSIMYTYYLLATFGPSLQPYLWWKRYLTSLQIAQFVLILIQLASIPLTGNDKCQYPRGFLLVAFAGAMLFLWLFYTYYIDTYTKKQQVSTRNPDQKSARNNQVQAQLHRPQEGRQAALLARQENGLTSLQSSRMAERLASLDAERNGVHRRKVNDESATFGQLAYGSSRASEREGSSRALAEAIENAIGSLCDLGQSDALVPNERAASYKQRHRRKLLL